MSRCSPNTRAASRVLIPSTITARRTRRYTSTLYIHRTIHRLDFEPMDDGRRYGFQSPIVSNSSAHMGHFTSADYTSNRDILGESPGGDGVKPGRKTIREYPGPVLVENRMLFEGLGIYPEGRVLPKTEREVPPEGRARLTKAAAYRMLDKGIEVSIREEGGAVLIMDERPNPGATLDETRTGRP